MWTGVLFIQAIPGAYTSRLLDTDSWSKNGIKGLKNF